jgi:hypothetical protein
MVQKERLIYEKSRIREMLTYLQDMSKEEIIQKCYDLASSLEKATEVFTELEELKAITPHIDKREYHNSWSWVNKIVFVLKKIDRPLLSSEIIEFITPYEPVLQYSRFRPQAFSAHLHKAVKYGRVIAYKLGGSRGYYYILPDWMDAAGRIMKEYENKIFFK